MTLLLRSNVEFAKRICLDRDGDPYVFGGTLDPANLGVGTDCSGLVTAVLSAVKHGPAMQWQRFGISTEAWRTNPQWMLDMFDAVRADSAAAIPHDAPVKVALHHGGGGANSHMWCEIDGWRIESSGAKGHSMFDDARSIDDPYANDWFYIPGPITEDTDWRQPRQHLRGVDYAGGRPGAEFLKADGYHFAVRYLSDGGPTLPGKQLLPAEADDLRAHGVSIVSNWETTANRMADGYDAGVYDAGLALAHVLACGGHRNRPIYFSADWDAAEHEQPAIDDYLRGAATVIGPENVGIYAGYWPLKRALDNGAARWAWQTEAWSGGNRDHRIHLMQLSHLGNPTVNGIPVDVNEAHNLDYGQWDYTNNDVVSITEMEEPMLPSPQINTSNRPDFNEYPVPGRGRNRAGARIDLFLIGADPAAGNADQLANHLAQQPVSGWHYTLSEDPRDHGVTVCDVVNPDDGVASEMASRAIMLCMAGADPNWNRQQWMASQNAIDVAAHIAVRDCRRYGVNPSVIAPPHWQDPPGVTGTDYLTTRLRDPQQWAGVGAQFPWDFFAQRVAFWSTQTQGGLFADATRAVDNIQNTIGGLANSILGGKPLMQPQPPMQPQQQPQPYAPQPAYQQQQVGQMPGYPQQPGQMLGQQPQPPMPMPLPGQQPQPGIGLPAPLPAQSPAPYNPAMQSQMPQPYGAGVAAQQRFPELGGRTVLEALAEIHTATTGGQPVRAGY